MISFFFRIDFIFIVRIISWNLPLQKNRCHIAKFTVMFLKT